MYVEKREKNVLRWQCILYKSRGNWTISHFVWDDNLQMLFAPCN